MLMYKDLLHLERQFRQTRVLSVYLPKVSEDPAQRESSHTLLHNELSRVRHALEESTRGERMAFAAASDALVKTLGTMSVSRSSLMAFATEQGVVLADRVLAPVPFHVAWQDGLVTSPYVRSLKQERAVLVVAVDSRTARLFRYQGGETELLESFDAHVRQEPAMHMGESARPHFHPGVRGATGRDETERREESALDRMLSQLAHRVEPERATEPWLVVGGMSASVHAVLRVLPRQLVERSTVVSALTTDSTVADVTRVASVAASELTARQDGVLVESLLDRAAAGARAVTGLHDVQRALEDRSVHLLLLSQRLVDEHVLLADAMVRGAFDGGSLVEVVTGAGAARLDSESGGVAAELRFVPTSPGAGGHARAAASANV
ncbi:MAG: hypothetical protein U0132_05675 [Gemmatimonadaceae bacterium]